MIPYAAFALILGAYILATSRLSPKPSLFMWFLRLFAGIFVGIAIGAIDFSIAVAVGEVDDPEKYLEWQYPQFALLCMSLTLAFFVAAKLTSVRYSGFFVLVGAALLGFWLTNAGLFRVLPNVFDQGLSALAPFFQNLVSVDRLSTSFFLRGVIIYSIASIAFVLLLLPRKQALTSKPLSQSKKEVNVRFKSSPNEPARLLMGMAAAARLPMIEKLRQQQEHPCQAVAFPMDIDPSDLIKLADKREEKNFGSRAAYFVVAAASLVAIIAEIPGLTLLGILVAGIIAFRQKRHDRENLIPAYQPKSFEAPNPPDGDDCRQNLVTYSGYNPFSQFGVQFGSWVLVVDTKRPKQDGLAAGPIKDPDLQELEKTITALMKEAGEIVGTPRWMYFVQGSNIPEDIKRQGASSPPVHLSEDRFANHAHDPSAPIRRYLWIRKSMWSKEITISYFVRLFRHGTDLNLEIVGVVMPPVSISYRWVDQFAPQGFWGVVFEFITSLFVGAWMLIWTPLQVLGKLQEGLANAIGAKARARRQLEKSVERTANYDFGAQPSVRLQVADFGPIQYFQQMDRRVAEAAFAGRVTRSFIDYLDYCNIDTSELREQRTTLLNQGIVVQGGDIKAENVAVGTGSKIQNLGQRARNTLGARK